MAIPEFLAQDERLATNIRISAFTQAVREISFVASHPSNIRPSLEGVLFSFENGRIRLVASDDLRLASTTITDVGEIKEFPKEIRVNARHLSLSTQLFFAPLSKSLLRFYDVNLRSVNSFVGKNLEISSRSFGGMIQIPQIPHPFPEDWRSLVERPITQAPKTTFKRAVLQDALNDFNYRGIISISGKKDKILIHQYATGEMGQKLQSLDVRIPANESTKVNPNLQVIFRTRHLKDLLKNVTSSEILSLEEDQTKIRDNAIIFRKHQQNGEDRSDFIYMVMPFKRN